MTEQTKSADSSVSPELAMSSYKTDDKNWYAPKTPASDNTTRIKFVKMTETAKLPKASRDGDIGFDVYADEDFTMFPGATVKVSTGIQLADMPPKDAAGNRIFMKVEGRSGLALKGIFPIGGIVDPTYRGEVAVVLTYNKRQDAVLADAVPFNKGDRIAQLVVYKVSTSGEVVMEEADKVTDTHRGTAGFGSSGK